MTKRSCAKITPGQGKAYKDPPMLAVASDKEGDKKPSNIICLEDFADDTKPSAETGILVPTRGHTNNSSNRTVRGGTYVPPRVNIASLRPSTSPNAYFEGKIIYKHSQKVKNGTCDLGEWFVWDRTGKICLK